MTVLTTLATAVLGALASALGIIGTRWWLARRAGHQLVERDTAPIRAIIEHRAAIHEAGHAICMWVSPYIVRINKVTIDEAAIGAGCVHATVSRNTSAETTPWHEIVCDLGGLAAEAMAFGSTRSGTARGDLIQARKRADRLADLGATTAPWKNGPGADDLPSLDIGQMFRAGSLSSDTEPILDEAYRHARAIVEARQSEVEAITTALLEHQGTIDSRDLAMLLGRRPFHLP